MAVRRAAALFNKDSGKLWPDVVKRFRVLILQSARLHTALGTETLARGSEPRRKKPPDEF